MDLLRGISSHPSGELAMCLLVDDIHSEQDPTRFPSHSRWSAHSASASLILVAAMCLFGLSCGRRSAPVDDPPEVVGEVVHGEGPELLHRRKFARTEIHGVAVRPALLGHGRRAGVLPSRPTGHAGQPTGGPERRVAEQTASSSPHCSRSATTGSMRVARRAGGRADRVPTVRRTRITQVRTQGSLPGTWKRRG